MSSHSEITRVGIILAGGFGERFWPLSRRSRPKQLLPLPDGKDTMLGEAVGRMAGIIPREHLYVVTSGELLELVRRAGIGVPDENVTAEPCPRNTAGALAYATAFILAKYGGDGSNLSMAVTTADHVIGDAERFRLAAQAALTAAEEEEVLAVLGITPTRPETGFGYIQVSDDLRTAPGLDGATPVYAVSAFHEKPSRERAEDFIAAGGYFWNSGMFFWRIAVFLAELETVRRDFAHAVRQMAAALRAKAHDKVRHVFQGLENISIDYALMEHAKRVVMVRADFPWDDLGAWPALERIRVRDKHGNVTEGNPVLIGAKDCIVYNQAGPEKVAVAVVGAEKLVVVVTEDGVLVVPKDRAQDVRHAVQELKRRNARQL